MKALILAGGNGTRLWPISRKLMPKQFTKLFNDRSLYQLTLQRNQKLCQEIQIVSNEEQYFIALDQSQEIGIECNEYLLEPLGRNTAPAIAIPSFGYNYDDIILVLPSDHLIKDEKAYQEAVQKAKKFAQEGYLVTFGIKPTFAQTGFGYIESDGYDVKAFHEKPDLKTATSYLKAGNYYWNSGMFCFKAGVLLDELKKHSPKIYETSKTAFQNASKNSPIRVKKEDMQNIPEESIDYALMEKSNRVKVIPSSISWSDVGSFDALHVELPKNKNQNTKTKHLIDIDSKNNLVLTDKKVALIDVDDLVVISTNDALLISKQGSSQKVKEVVSHLKAQDSNLPNIHLTVHRPWGTYTVLEDSPTFKIKRILVKPKKRLSLQKHYHRNEHWVIVSGTAVVQVGDKEMTLRSNESTYIHAGVLHRLENKGNINLLLIEVQVGEYLGEDDIVRVEDDYNRSENCTTASS